MQAWIRFKYAVLRYPRISCMVISVKSAIWIKFELRL
jgi:hypothetical protein